jgi:hypothetical protein
VDDGQARRKAAAVWFLMSQGIAAVMHDKIKEMGYSMPPETFQAWLKVGEWSGAVAKAVGLDERDRVDAFRGGVQFGKDMFDEAVARMAERGAAPADPPLLTGKPDGKLN